MCASILCFKSILGVLTTGEIVSPLLVYRDFTETRVSLIRKLYKYAFGQEIYDVMLVQCACLFTLDFDLDFQFKTCQMV